MIKKRRRWSYIEIINTRILLPNITSANKEALIFKDIKEGPGVKFRCYFNFSRAILASLDFGYFLTNSSRMWREFGLSPIL